MKTNRNASAFSIPEQGGYDMVPGLTKREWFAGMALRELVKEWEPAGAARYAIEAADALIEALNDDE